MNRLSGSYISFKGIRNDAVGAKLIEMPTIGTAAPKGKKVDIPGRDGALFIADGGYGSITIKMNLAVPKVEDMPTVLNWLTGSGALIIGDAPEYYYNATVITAGQYDNLLPRLGGKRLQVTFTCDPFKYWSYEKPYELNASNTTTVVEDSGTYHERTFAGMGTYYARPIITVYTSGTDDLTKLIINGWEVRMTAINGSVTLDCDAMMSYDHSDSPNRCKYTTITTDEDDDWPMLYPNRQNNRIGYITRTQQPVTKVIVKPNWRWR